MRQSWGLPLKTGSPNVVIHLRYIPTTSKGAQDSNGHRQDIFEEGIECVPDWQLCRNCYSKQHQILEKNNDSLDEEANITEIESEFMQDSLSDHLNGSLEAIDESPVKTHGMPKHRRLSYANAKFDKTSRAIKQHISSAIGASATEISLPSEEPSSSVGIEQKAKDLDQVMEDVKSQVAVSTFRRRIQLLTLAPKSWTIRYTAGYFDVSRYLVQKAF